MRVLFCLFITAGAIAAAEWTAVSSPNFRLITTAGAGEARRTIEYFEQVRDFSERIRPTHVKNRLPVTIVLFRNEKEFRPYAPSEAAMAFYTGDHARDYIVMSGAGDDDKPVAVHEYMHLLVRRMELDLPPWLNEGIAELYSTLRPRAGKIALGMVPQGRAITLTIEKWIPLKRLVEVEQDDPEYNKKAHAGTFYAQSWMLVHMLALSDSYAKGFGKFVAAVSDGATSEAAFQAIYGKDLAAVSRDLNAYYRADSLKLVLFDTSLEKFARFEPKPADPFEVELHLARIKADTGHTEEAWSRLQKLKANNPERWEIYEAIGSVAVRRRDMLAAEAAYRRAVNLKPDDWSVYWNYAKVAQQDPAQKEPVLAALQQTIKLNSANVDAIIALSEQLSWMNRPTEALEVLKPVKSVTPERAVRLFLAKAHANIGLNELEAARIAALRAKKYAKPGQYSAELDRVFDYLARRRDADRQRKELEEARKTGSPAQAVPVPAPPAPMLARAETPQPKQPANSSRIEGILKNVECLGGKARLNIESGRGPVNLLIADPGAIEIRNQPGSSVNLLCGPQPAASRVAVEYREAADAKHKTTGEVRSIEFLGR